MTQCNKGKCLLSLIAVIIVMGGYEMLVNHSAYMMDLYRQTQQLWREPAQMQSLLPWFIARTVVLSAVIVCLYKKFAAGKMALAASCAASGGEVKKCCPIGCGICFGIKIGVIMGVIQASSYIWMPISETLAVTWLVSAIVEGALIGLALGLINKNTACEIK